jgi:hypothetical protein
MNTQNKGKKLWELPASNTMLERCGRQVTNSRQRNVSNSNIREMRVVILSTNFILHTYPKTQKIPFYKITTNTSLTTFRCAFLSQCQYTTCPGFKYLNPDVFKIKVYKI